MTQTGKCDTCRQRKVKCDEDKPKCGACRKKDRPCSYTYGKASAFVVQDPNQLTKHGKSKIAPVVYALNVTEEKSSSSISLPLELRLSSQRTAGSGNGTFQTLAPVTIAKIRPSKKAVARRRRALDAYLQQLQLESSLAQVRPSSAESTLVARWVDMLGSGPRNNRPLSILGTWIQSVPSRVGSSRILDLAVEFLINSYAVYWDDCYSKRQIVSTTKSKALKELQLAVANTQSRNTYEVVLATKMHYAAETLLGIDTMYHAIHAFGLAELLKAGAVSNIDDEHYWNLIDNTYIDDVNEAMLAGRASVYDNDYYLSTTYPPSLVSDVVSLTPTQRASMSIMHVFVQCPRLNCLVRHAIANPEDANSLAAAVILAEYMWETNLPMQVAELLNTSVTVVSEAPSSNITDILSNTLHFDSVQSMILCTRYWMLQNVLCGLTDTLHRHFPTEMALSRLPDGKSVQDVDIDAGIHLAESLTWAESVSQRLPLVPLRLHTPLQISIGPWHRIIRQVTSHSAFDSELDPGEAQKASSNLSRALRMKTWLIDKCNRIHEQWDVSTVDENSLYEALDSMAGEEIPDWLPTRVRFEAEDGDMVIRLDYEKPAGNRQKRYALGDGRATVEPQDNTSDGPTPDESGSLNLAVDMGPSPESSIVEQLSCDMAASGSSVEAADFLFRSGRNLCSTAGWWPAPETNPNMAMNTKMTQNISYGPCMASSWWPQRPRTSAVLLDSTHKTSAFQPQQRRKKEQSIVTLDNRKVNGCMSPAWKPNGSSSSPAHPNASSASSEWSTGKSNVQRANGR